MRTWLIVMTLVATANAGPPSKTLERAIKLYDKQDFLSAHIELTKVTEKETGDDPANVQRAEFFIAKVLYHIGMYATSLSMLDQIASKGDAHTYYTASLKWLHAVGEKLPIEIEAISKYPMKVLEDPSLEAVLPELLFVRGVYSTNRGDYAAATTAFNKIDKSSAAYARSRLALGFVQVRTAKHTEALATFAKIKAGDDIGDHAALAAGQLHARAKAWDKATASYQNVRATGPLRPRAAFEASWAVLEQKKTAPQALGPLATTPIVGLDPPEPAVLPSVLAFDYCAKRTANPDGLAGFRTQAAATVKELAAIVAQDRDDNGQFYARITKHLAGASKLSPRTLALVKTILAGPVPARQIAWVTELERENDAYTKLDRAYLTTQAAANVQQDIVVQKALAASTAGRAVRDRLESLLKDVTQLEKLAATKVPVGDGGLAIPCPAP